MPANQPHKTFRRACMRMKSRLTSLRCLWLIAAAVIAAAMPWCATAQPYTLNTNLQFRLLLNTTNASGVNSVRIAKDPRNNELYYLKLNGDIYQIDVMPGDGTSTSSLVYSSADHGLSQNVEGMAIGPDGTIYLVGNDSTNSGQYTIARIVKGVPNGGGRTWSLLAQAEPYPLGNTGYDHLFNGIIVSLDGASVYVNSGARTDHGEVQSDGGVFPNTRDVPLTAKIFVLPTSASGLFLTNDLTALRAGGWIFAEGVRNAFDFGFAPDGKLFAIDNGPDRDMSDELNWLRAGLHYGFPWRMGGADNPQQFPNYNPTNDPLLDPRFFAVEQGFYQNDPTFPPPPTNSFAEPVLNIGPDADEFRNPTNGAYEDASALGQAISTFTAHRAPCGLVFDRDGAMASPFHNHGFVLGYTPGDANGTNAVGPFFDPSQDLLDLDLVPLGGTNFQTQTTRIMAGFAEPIDTEIISNRIYVIEYGGNQGVWEITFPATPPRTVLTMPQRLGGNAVRFTVTGAVPGQTYQIQRSTNLFDWTDVQQFMPTNGQFVFTDAGATSSVGFYRVKSGGP